MRRSRRAANDLAQERLKKEKVDEQDVVDTLKLWYFKENKTRTNVFPVGVTYINSDTLGLVRTRTGTVVVTSLTKKYPMPFLLFCKWLRDNLPSSLFDMQFPFTSINVNYRYAGACFLYFG